METSLLKYCLICQAKRRHDVMPVTPLRYIQGTSAYYLCCQNCHTVEGFDSFEPVEAEDDEDAS